MSLSLDSVLRFRPNLRVVVGDAKTVYLISERERFTLSNPGLGRVVALVDGRRDVQEIMCQSGPSVPEAQVFYVLSQLLARGYLVPVTSEDVAPEKVAYWHDLGFDGQAALENISTRPVSVVSLGVAEHAERMREALLGAGVRVEPSSPLAIMVTDDYLRPELAGFNELALREGRRWCLVKMVGSRPLIGPFFEVGSGPCWECLAFWMSNGRPVERLLRRLRGEAETRPPLAMLEGSVRTASGLAALVIARGLASSDGARNSISGQVLALDLASFQTTPHTVVKRPQCRACGDPRRMASIGERRVELSPVEKSHCSDGGYRRSSPRETFERYRHLIGPITGAVTHVVPMPGKDSELRAVYASGYLVCPQSGVPSTNVFDKPCAGKGRTSEQARASALCEALERYSGVYQGDEARLRASWAELGAAALPPAELLNFSEAQYRARQRVRQEAKDAREVAPEPLDPNAPIDWTPAWSLTRRERRYVPLTYCFSEAPPDSGTAYCTPCGNGVAAGTRLEEAILQGLLELIERDAVAVWWYNRVSRPAIDLASFRDSYFEALRADYERLGWKLWALDLTHDLGIPVCAALAHEPEQERYAIGFGCHLEARLAVQRALTELNQLFEPNGQRRAPWDSERLTDHEYLFPHPDAAAVTLQDFPTWSSPDLRADIQHCQRRLEAAGLELVVVDKTRPDIGLNVAQVIVPGLRHFWPRFAPGRLYEVPVALGWLRQPLSESELNPVPLFV